MNSEPKTDESESSSGEGNLSENERIELTTQRELRKHLDSHVGYLSKLAAWTATAALVLLGILGSGTAWVFSGKLTSIIDNLNPKVEKRINEEVDNALKRASVPSRLEKSISHAEKKVDFQMRAKVETEIEKKSGIIDRIVKEFLHENAARALLNQVNKDFAGLPKRVNSIDQRIAIVESEINPSQNKAVILAALRVSNGKLLWSTNGVTYDASSGVVSFPNPKKYHFVPLISNEVNNKYATETHYIRSIDIPNKFQVWNTPLDTGGRNRAPVSFTAAIIASKSD